MKKAFDTISHDVLMDKLERYGIRGQANCWLKSYLLNRQHQVRIGSALSDLKNINIGVPQGSLLSPLLFNLYINDMPEISSNIKFTLFADDTTLTINDSNYSNLITRTNLELEKLYTWTINIRLYIIKHRQNISVALFK